MLISALNEKKYKILVSVIYLIVVASLAPFIHGKVSASVNYASCHDNMTLFDRIVNSTPDASREDQIKMNNLAAAIYMTSQGIPFVHAGEEMLRSKPTKDGGFDENSYASPDSVNKLKWDDLNSKEYQDVYKYYQGLIAFRKEHAALRMTTAKDVKDNITALEGLDKKCNGISD